MGHMQCVGIDTAAVYILATVIQIRVDKAVRTRGPCVHTGHITGARKKRPWYILYKVAIVYRGPNFVFVTGTCETYVSLSCCRYNLRLATHTHIHTHTHARELAHKMSGME